MMQDTHYIEVEHNGLPHSISRQDINVSFHFQRKISDYVEDGYSVVRQQPAFCTLRNASGKHVTITVKEGKYYVPDP